MRRAQRTASVAVEVLQREVAIGQEDEGIVVFSHYYEYLLTKGSQRGEYGRHTT